MKRRSRDEHLFDDGPKRILALDGGGLRGMLSLQILRRIESLVRERTGDPDARLGDYFDLIGGTSTGAIIAASLAIGRTVDELEVSADEAESLQQMDRPANLERLAEVGRRAAERLVDPAHFPAAFDLGGDAP